MLPTLGLLALAAAASAARTGRTLGTVAAPPPLSARCPVSNCPGVAGAAGAANTSSPGNDGEGERKPFDVAFKPGHFVCKSCDASACEGCAVLCDLEQCSGEFFTQQCWCEEGSFRKKTHKVFCDEDCSGGVCDDPRLRCRSRKDACTPWWWCGEAPPKWGPGGGGSSSGGGGLAGVQEFLQSGARLWGGSKRQRWEASSSSSSVSLASQSLLGGGRAAVGRAAALAAEGLRFSTGRFDCFSAAMPPKVWDEQALMWMDRGYLILDRRTCEGAVYDKKCYCWDDFKYKSGQDPLTSELKCDGHCRMGPCDGKTCGRHPPPPLPAPTAAPGTASVQQIREGRLIMEPVDAPVATDTGR